MRKMISLNCSICSMTFLGLERYIEFGLPKAVLASSAHRCLSFLPFFFGLIVSGELLKQLGTFRALCRNPKKQGCHTLQRVDLARPFLVSPAIESAIENSLEMALTKAKSGSTWQSYFWQCGTLRAARDAKLFA